MAAGLRLWLLGGFWAEAGGRAVPEMRWHRRKACSLVKLLALAPRHRLHREQLMDILWPDLPPDAAGANLRKAVHFARQAVGPGALRSRDGSVWLEPDGLWVDVDAFQAAIAAEDAAGALGLFRGDLLPEDRFEPWAAEPRELFRIQLFRLALRMAAELEQAEELGRASSVLERVVELDALNEEAHLMLARVQAKTGHRHLALRTLLQIQERLRQELGERPSAEARRLRDDIVAGRIGQGTESAGGRRPGGGGEDLLVDERRVVTVVVVLPASSHRGTEAGHTRREIADRSCEVVQAWGGSAQRSDDASVTAVFGLPLLHENDAGLALSAALEIVGRSAAPVCIGVHTGEIVGPPLPVLTGVSGDALILARRLAEAAKPGTVLVSERTHRAAGTQFVFTGPARVPGPAGEATVRARRMLSRRHAVPEWDVPGDSPFVGRRFDLDAIAALFEDVVATGQPRMVTVVGPAGIGKSRLVREAITAVSRRHPSARILTGRCIAAERGMTWWPLAELLYQLCGISLEDSAETAGGKLRESLTSILIRAGFADGELDPVVFALAATAAIAVPGNPLDRCEPTLVADELGRTWPRFLSACAAGAPTLIIIEDLHWAGQQMLEMVERLATRGNGPYLVVGTTRPELLESRRGFGAGVEGSSTISLRALSNADSATLLRRLPVAQQIPDAIAAEILARSEGNPFFIEQLAFHLAHDPGNPLPDALYAVLAARIDALPVPERRVLQEAAVFGRVFWAAALSDTVPGIDILAELRRLERRALVSLRPRSTLGDRAEYAFKHVLVRDVAYASLPTARRVRAHAEASSWIEAMAGDRLEEFVELIAFHDVEAAGEPGAWQGGAEYDRIRTRAYHHALQAASTARRKSAVDNAFSLDRQALQLSSGDRERIDALTALGDDCRAAFRGDVGRHHYEQALRLARANASLDPERARLCARLAYMMAMFPGSFRVSPDPIEVDRLVDEGLAVAGGDEVNQARLLVAKGVSARLWRGSEPFGQGTRPDPSPISERIASVHTALKVGERKGLDDLIDSADAALSVLYGVAGRYDDALAIAERRLARAETRPRQELVDALRTAAILTITIKGDFETGLEVARRCYALARDAVAHQRMHVTWPLLAALYHLGRWDEMFPIAEEHVAAYAQEPAAECQFVRDGPLIAASALAHMGQLEQARLLAAIPGDPAADPDTASNWQAWYLVASGDPASARVIAGPKALEGRSFGPQYAMVLVEALVALEDWSALDEILPHARAATAGNALLEPFCDRAQGLMTAACGDRHSARKHLVRALTGFEKFKVQYQATRTRQVMDALTAAQGGSSEATLPTRAESSSRETP
jgi:DNA-binding SARP family transcriptional activator/tetratricopeptide (TPR) repeat protein